MRWVNIKHNVIIYIPILFKPIFIPEYQGGKKKRLEG